VCKASRSGHSCRGLASLPSPRSWPTKSRVLLRLVVRVVTVPSRGEALSMDHTPFHLNSSLYATCSPQTAHAPHQLLLFVAFTCSLSVSLSLSLCLSLPLSLSPSLSLDLPLSLSFYPPNCERQLAKRQTAARQAATERFKYMHVDASLLTLALPVSKRATHCTRAAPA